MTRPLSRIPLAAACLLAALHAPAHAEDAAKLAAMPAERALAAASLASMQFAAKQTQSKKPRPALFKCLMDLQPEVLVPLYRREFELALTPDEIAATEAIYGGPLRQKIFDHGVAVVYRAHGEVPPNGDVVFTPSEDAQLMQYVNTSAGGKLMRNHALDTPAIAKIEQERVTQILADCKAKTAGR